MAVPSDLQNISLKTYDVTFRDSDLGTTALDTLTLSTLGIYIDAEADQFAGIVQSFQTGLPVSVEMTLQNVDIAFLANKLFAGQVEVDTVAGKTKMSFGNIKRKMNDTAVAGQLRLHPTGVARTDRSNDILVHIAAPKFENFQLVGSRTAVQGAAVTFVSFPDLNQPAGEEYAVLGDDSISSVTPLAVIIAPDFEALNPLIGMSAATMIRGEKERYNAFRINGSVDAGSTALIDNVGGYTATDTDLIFDTGATPNAFAIGDYVQIGSEFLFVSNVVYTSTIAGTLTVIRGAFNSVAASMLNDAIIKLVSDVAAILARDTVTWASDDASVTAGDVFQGTTITRKGQLTENSAGSAVITATFNAVISADFTITAL